MSKCYAKKLCLCFCSKFLKVGFCFGNPCPILRFDRGIFFWEAARQKGFSSKKYPNRGAKRPDKGFRSKILYHIDCVTNRWPGWHKFEAIVSARNMCERAQSHPQQSVLKKELTKIFGNSAIKWEKALKPHLTFRKTLQDIHLLRQDIFHAWREPLLKRQAFSDKKGLLPDDKDS